MMGGGNNSTGPAPVGYGLAQTPEAAIGLAQGRQYAGYHMNQHGGEAPYPQQVVGSTLPLELHGSARIEPLDGYFNDIRGLKDPNQMGAGRRRRNNMKGGRRANENSNPSPPPPPAQNIKNNIPPAPPAPPSNPMPQGGGRRKGRKGRKTLSRRNMRGGASLNNTDPASTTAPGLLLDPATEARAVRGMNPEWYLAPDPNSFTPRS